jgi:hypothetical protein
MLLFTQIDLSYFDLHHFDHFDHLEMLQQFIFMLSLFVLIYRLILAHFFIFLLSSIQLFFQILF